jgi:hypothetical protein
MDGSLNNIVPKLLFEKFMVNDLCQRFKKLSLLFYHRFAFIQPVVSMAGQ